MTQILTFLNARFGEDERDDRCDGRSRRDAQAKRRILALHPMSSTDPIWSYGPDTDVPVRHHCECQTDDGLIYGEWPCETLRLLAWPYDQHPDYDESWQPS